MGAECRGIHKTGDSPLRLFLTLSVEEQDRRQTQHLQVFFSSATSCGLFFVTSTCNNTVPFSACCTVR